MQKVILQPSQKDHFEDTILKGRSIADIRPYLPTTDQSLLNSIYNNSLIQIWGITPGVNNINVGKWEKIENGDVALFVEDKVIMYLASVAHKLHNKELALNLWGEDGKGQTWEYIYFLVDGAEETIPIHELNPLLGYDDEFFPRGVMVLSEEKSKGVLSEYGNFENLFDEVQSKYSKPRKEDAELVKQKAVKVKSVEDIDAMLNDLQQQLQEAEPKRRRRIASAVVRNAKIAKLVKERAGYKCEICGRDGFEKKDGSLYAEAHHKDELGGGGADLPNNIICACPLCHRKIHYGKSLD